VVVNSPMISSMISRGHQALQLPILVHHERDALVVLLEVLELREHRRAGGTK